MNELPTITRDQYILREVLTSEQPNMYTGQRNGRQQFDISFNDSDQLIRKNTLLKRKGKILQKTTVAVWNSFSRILCINCILSISSLQYGFGLCQITTVWNSIQLDDAYGFSLPHGLSLGMMVCFVPLGGFFGCLFAPIVLRLLRRKNALLVNNIICIIATAALMQINTVATILIGRFIYGCTIACCCYWSYLIVHQISPVNLHAMMESIFNIGRVLALMIGYLLGLIFYQSGVSNYYRIMFCIPGILAVVQTVLMFLCVPDSPTELFQRRDYEQGRRVLTMIYKPEFVDLMFDKFKLEAEVAVLRLKAEQPEQPPQFQIKAYKAMIMGVHLNIFRQLVGFNTIICYAGIILSLSYVIISPYANFIISSTVVVGSVLSSLLIADRIGRKSLLIWSSVLFTICNLMIALGQLIDLAYFSFGWMIIFAGTYGLLYSPVCWTYPAEILPAEHTHYASLASWPALIFTTLIPPIVSDVMSSNSSWPVFVFYGVYCVFSSVYVWLGVVQSKRRNYVQIINDF